MSVKLDGKGQYLGRNDDLSPLGIANTWTLGFWVEPQANKEHTAIFSTGDNDGCNEIQVFTTAVPAETVRQGKSPAELRVLIKDSDGTTIKQYGWPDWFQTEVWTHTFVQWNGVVLDAFKDGFITTTGVALVNATGTMTDTTRQLYYGSAIAGAFATFSGIAGHFGMWDSILGSEELLTIVSGGFSSDLVVASGSYVSQADLQHYYRPGDIPGTLGKDFSGSLDLTKQRNMDSTNVTSDKP